MARNCRGLGFGLVSVLLVSFACSKDETPPSGPTVVPSARGVVTLIGTEAPVPGAVVVLVDPVSLATRSIPTRTDSLGRYEVTERVTPGRYSLFLYTDSTVVFDRGTPYLTVQEGKTTAYDVRMVGAELWDRSKPFVNGLVLDDATGAPISGAYVEPGAWGFQGDDIRSQLIGTTLPDLAVTDHEGRFSITDISVVDDQGTRLGLLPISFSKSGYEATTLVGRGANLGLLGRALLFPAAASDSILNVTIRLHPLGQNGIGPHGAGSLTGRVLSGSAGIGGIHVAASLILSSNPDTFPAVGKTSIVPEKIAVTDAQGRFTISGLAPGSYGLEPAYLLDDGYVHDFSRSAGTDTVNVVLPGVTVEVGDFHLARALQPTSPRPGSAISDTSRVFSWTPMPETPGYTRLWYRVWYSDHWFERHSAEPLATCSWSLPDSLALHRGDHIRWSAEAIGTVGSSPDTVVIGEFEEPATFTVR